MTEYGKRITIVGVHLVDGRFRKTARYKQRLYNRKGQTMVMCGGSYRPALYRHGVWFFVTNAKTILLSMRNWNYDDTNRPA